MFIAGDKVVHPGHGPGVIRCIERRQMFGEEKKYYIIDMMTGGGTLMTPVTKANEVGLRSAISHEAAERLFQLLTEEPVPLSGDFKERQSDVEERLKEGNIFQTVGLVRDLAWYGQGQGLTKRDMQLMQRAEELVAGELALVEGIEVKEAIQRMQNVLETVVNE